MIYIIGDKIIKGLQCRYESEMAALNLNEGE
jgi:hypothetical protein